MSNFFVIPVNGQALLGMPDIEILYTLTINCNTIGTQEADKTAKYSISTAKDHGSEYEQHYTNTRKDADRVEVLYKHRQ